MNVTKLILSGVNAGLSLTRLQDHKGVLDLCQNWFIGKNLKY